jgi:predicted negative regulator of RcsB-dependent stress response
MDVETESTDLYVRTIEWLHANRKPLLIGVVVLAVAGLAWAVISWKKTQDETDANAQFFAAPSLGLARSGPVSAAPLLEVAKEYPGTAAGEHARVLAAEELFTQGQYPEAYQQFSDFLAAYPESAAVPQAKVGVAACLEAEGKTSDAITKYHDIILAYPTEMSIVSPAKLTLARLYDEVNQPQQALSLYVELARMLKQNQYDPWAAEAQERAQLLISKHPELMKSMTSAAPAPTSAPSGFSIPQPVNPASRPGAMPAPVAPPAPGFAPKLSPPPAQSSNGGLKLLNMPAASSNSTSKP